MKLTVDLNSDTFRRLDVHQDSDGKNGHVFILTATELYSFSTTWPKIAIILAGKADPLAAASELLRLAGAAVDRLKLADIVKVIRRHETRKKEGDVHVVEIQSGARRFGSKSIVLLFSSSERETEFMMALRQESGKRFEQRVSRTPLWDAIAPAFFTAFFTFPFALGIALSAFSEAPPEGRRRRMQTAIEIGQSVGPIGAVAINGVLVLGFAGWAGHAISRRGEQTVERVLHSSP